MYPIFENHKRKQLLSHISHQLLPTNQSQLNCTMISIACRSFDDAAELEGCEVHGFDPSGLLWRQGMHGSDYSGIDYAKVKSI